MRDAGLQPWGITLPPVATGDVVALAGFAGLPPRHMPLVEPAAKFPCAPAGTWYQCRIKMTMRPSSHDHLRATLLALAATGLVSCPSCSGEPMSTADGSRATRLARGEPRAVATPSASPSKILPVTGRYPDPRYRPAMNFSELQVVAGQVARATGRKIRWRLELGKNPGPLVMIRGGLDDCTIAIHPVAARKVPPNTWAFLFGHEFAHLVANLGTQSQTNPSNELKADIAGARYAMAAGYRIEAFLGWVLTERDQSSDSHGTLHGRVQAIAARFGVRQNVIRAEAQRYSGKT